MKQFFRNFFSHLNQLFLLKYLWVHGVAIIGTYIIVMSGFDWWYFILTRDSAVYQYLRPALGLGMIVPVILPFLFLFIYSVTKNKLLEKIGIVLLESAFVGWLLSSVYKAFTGRIQPPHNTLVDTSHSFNFGFMEHGIFWGWPSSHTTVAFASMTALYFILPKKYTWLGVLGLVYALYVGVAVSFQIHWFSEFFAGMFFGSLVGYIVSRAHD